MINDLYIKATAPASAAPVGATLMKTGQTTSYATGDDGATQRGRLTNFTTLHSNNPFGNTNRFTNKTGGQTYTTSVAIDWSTYNGTTVLAYYFGDVTFRTLNAQMTQYTTSTIDGLNGWYVTNYYEFNNILNASLWANYMLNYPPFSTTRRYFWISTQPAGTGGAYTDLASINIWISAAKTSSLGAIWCRVCTVNGTTIS